MIITMIKNKKKKEFFFTNNLFTQSISDDLATIIKYFESVQLNK